MASWKDKDNCTLQLETSILVNFVLIKNREEVFIIGLVKKVMFIKVNSKVEKEMEEEHFGGVMVAGIKVNLGMEYRVDGEFYIEKVDIKSTKDIGITVCSMAKALNFSKTDNVTKVPLNRINFTVMVFSTKMTP